MKKGNNKPPMIGQPTVDAGQAAMKTCTNCPSQYYAEVYRMGVVSKLAAGNNTGQDVPIKIPVYVCVGCGVEFGKEKVNDAEV